MCVVVVWVVGGGVRVGVGGGGGGGGGGWRAGGRGACILTCHLPPPTHPPLPSPWQVWVDLGGGTGENVSLMSDYIDLSRFKHIYLVDLCKSLCTQVQPRCLSPC